LGLGTTSKDTEGLRATLKRLVARQILIESEPDLFTLAAATHRPHRTRSRNANPLQARKQAQPDDRPLTAQVSPDRAADVQIFASAGSRFGPPRRHAKLMSW
jgi:hypothetical protein